MKTCYVVNGVVSIYKHDLGVNVTSSRKCDCPFKLQDKPIYNGEGWVLNDMTNNLIKSTKILLNLRKHNKDNITIIR